MKEQRRGRRIAPDVEERAAFLGEALTCRIATTGPGGPPAWLTVVPEKITSWDFPTRSQEEAARARQG